MITKYDLGKWKVIKYPELSVITDVYMQTNTLINCLNILIYLFTCKPITWSIRGKVQILLIMHLLWQSREAVWDRLIIIYVRVYEACASVLQCRRPVCYQPCPIFCSVSLWSLLLFISWKQQDTQKEVLHRQFLKNILWPFWPFQQVELLCGRMVRQVYNGTGKKGVIITNAAA